jgi:diguanylate cyclase (GGDEF)-like protein/PAS domain S-box-containing protein
VTHDTIGDAPVADVMANGCHVHVAPQLFAAIVESSDDAILSKTLDGVITSWNAAAARLYGYTTEEMVGESVARLIPPDRWDEQQEELAELRAGRSVDHRDTVRLRRDGAPIALSITVSPLFGEDGTVIGASSIAHDIGPRIAVERALKAAERRYHDLIEQLPAAIYIEPVDETEATRYISPEIERMLGYSKEQWSSDLNIWRTLLHPDDRERMIVNYNLPVEIGGRSTFEYRLIAQDGRTVWVRDQSVVVRDDATGTIVRHGLLIDISTQKTLEARLLRQALYDNLTELPNRALLIDRGTHAIARASRDNRPVAILLLNLSGFKSINETFGHESGNILLTEVGRRLQGLVRKSDTVARLAADEFVVLLEGSDAADALRVIETLGAGLDEPYRIDGHSIFVNARFGVAIYPDHGSDIQALLRHAEVASDRAAERGTRHAIFDPAQDEQSQSRLALVGDLRRAIGGDQLLLYYQPKIDLHTRTVRGVEALVRWSHPRLGWIPPTEFIELAERSGVIRSLTDWIMNSAFAQCAAWQRQGVPINVAVNLSTRDLNDRSLVETVTQALERWSVDPSLITLEITETSLMLSPTVAMNVVARLHDMGIRIAVDDFGTGYSSLSYLKQLSVDEIKIDRSFVMTMSEEQKDAAIVTAVVGLGHNLGLEVVAEGVETDAALELLRAAECDHVQGYLFSRPIPDDAVAPFIAGFV